MQNDMHNGDVSDIAARLKRRHDTDEASRLEQQRVAQLQAERAARNVQREQEVKELLDGVVAEVNSQLPQPLIKTAETTRGREYRFGNRTLTLHFFCHGALYDNPLVPGRMETLRKRHAEHGGYIEIKEGGEDREGWNLVLVWPEDGAGEWRIVDTRVSPLTGRVARFEPFATEAQLFADNLACHWSPAMHVYNLTDKPLERGDLVKILGVFVS